MKDSTQQQPRPDFVRLGPVPEVKLCPTCQAATDSANPFPRGYGKTSVFKDAEGNWGFTYTPHPLDRM